MFTYEPDLKFLRKFIRRYPAPHWMGDLFASYYSHGDDCPCEIHFTSTENDLLKRLDWNKLKDFLFNHPAPTWLGNYFAGIGNEHLEGCFCVQCEKEEYIYSEDEDD